VESSVEKSDLGTSLALVQGQFEDFCAATDSMRRLAKKCRQYKDGDHYTAEERKTLERRKQPVITDNKIQDKVDTLMGLEKQQRTDPKAYPRTPQDEGAAEAATDALRYVADACDYQRTARKPAVENLIVEGWCYGEVYVDKNSRDRKICMDHIRVDRGYHDVRSLRPDFSDKEYAGYFTWMDERVVRTKWKNSDAVIDKSFEGMGTVAGTDTEHEDKPNRYVELNGSRKRVQVFTHYHKQDGVWHFSRWCKGGFLEAPKPSPYRDEDDKPDCTIEIQALYRNSDGDCYGSVQRYLDLMDEHNKRRSKLLHLLNSKRLIAQRGAFEDINKARAELHKPDGVLEYGGNIDQVRVEDNLSLADGQFKLLQYTDAMLSQVGPNAALAGLSGDISGRAKEIDQASGSLPLLPIFDAVDAWEIRMYRKAWLCVRQFWNAEMWIRVTDDERKIRFVALNQRVTVGELKAERLKTDPRPAEEKQAILQKIAADPASQAPATRNDVARMDVDIIIARTQDTVNVQAEQFQMLATLAEKRPEVPFAVLVEASQLRSEVKRRILDALPGGGDAQNAMVQQAMQQVQQQAQVVAEAMKELEAAKLEAERAQSKVEKDAADLKVQAAEIKVAKAELSQQAAELGKERAEFKQLKAETGAAVALDQAAAAGEQADAKSQTADEQTDVVADVLSGFQQQAQQMLQAVAQELAQLPERFAAMQPVKRSVKGTSMSRGPNGWKVKRMFDDGTEDERDVVTSRANGQLQAQFADTVQ
jgi:hypothetical protein